MERALLDIQAKLSGQFCDRDIEKVMRAVQEVLTEYSVEPAAKELAVWEPQLPEAYRAYMVTRRIEGLSRNTLAQYQMTLEHFFGTVQKPIGKITAADIRLYLFRLWRV